MTQIVPKHPQNATVEFALMSYRWSLIKHLAKGMVLIGLFVFPDSFPNVLASVPASSFIFCRRSSLGKCKLPPDCASSLATSPFHNPLPYNFHSGGIQHCSWSSKSCKYDCPGPPSSTSLLSSVGFAQH